MKQLELIPRPANYNQIIDDLSKLIMVGALAYIALKKEGGSQQKLKDI